MQGRTVVVTGATDGIGKVTARELSRRGAEVVLVGRNPDKGAAVLEELRSRSAGEALRLETADLMRLDEVRALGERLSRLPRLDVLVNNAGALFAERRVTADGLERTFALNHMSYFLLTGLLLPLLQRTGGARIVNVASLAHRGVSLDFDDLQGERRWSGWTAYKRSKLANVMFTYALARRLEGTGVTANSLHPGFVRSRFGQGNAGWVVALVRVAQRFGAISEEKGAETSIHLAADPSVGGVSGHYFDDCKAIESSPQSRDEAAQERLWRLSEEIAGFRYPA